MNLTWMLRFTMPVKFLLPVGIVPQKDISRKDSLRILFMNNNSYVLVILHSSP